MSLDAFRWASSSQLNSCPSGARCVLFILADFCRPGSDQAWPSISTIMDRTGLSDRSIQRYLTWLEEHFIIRSGDQSLAENYPAGRRPHVWQLMMNTVQEESCDEVHTASEAVVDDEGVTILSPHPRQNLVKNVTQTRDITSYISLSPLPQEEMEAESVSEDDDQDSSVLPVCAPKTALGVSKLVEHFENDLEFAQTRSDFDKLASLWPKAPGNTRTLWPRWCAAVADVGVETILAAAEAYLASKAGQEVRYVMSLKVFLSEKSSYGVVRSARVSEKTSVAADSERDETEVRRQAQAWWQDRNFNSRMTKDHLILTVPVELNDVYQAVKSLPGTVVSVYSWLDEFYAAHLERLEVA